MGKHTGVFQQALARGGAEHGQVVDNNHGPMAKVFVVCSSNVPLIRGEPVAAAQAPHALEVRQAVMRWTMSALVTRALKSSAWSARQPMARSTTFWIVTSKMFMA
jgi:hypothetical protein